MKRLKKPLTPSGSKVELVVTCPGSRWLPAVANHHDAADDGTDCHDYINNYRIKGIDFANEKLSPRLKERLRDLNFGVIEDILGSDVWIPELAVALDPATGKVKELGSMLGRDYSGAPDGWIPLTADAVVVTNDHPEHGGTEVLVADWKFGRWPVAPPERNWQAKVAAIAFGALFDADFVTAKWVQFDETGVPYPPMVMTWDALDLGAMMAELREALAADHFVTGPHCTFCPALHECEVQQKLVGQIMERPQFALTAENAPELYLKLSQVERMARTARKHLQEFVRNNGPVDLGNGEQLTLKTRASESIDVSIAAEVLAEMGGGVAMGQLKTAIQKALPGKAGKAALKEIKDRGGVKVSYSETLGTVRGKDA